jgi:hypothetical protein
MGLKVTLTVTVSNPDTGWQQQTKDSVLTFDPTTTAADIADKAMRFLKEEIDHPRLPLEENPNADATTHTRDEDMTDEEWEASLKNPEPANA